MSLIRRLDGKGDWSYGHGKADYATEDTGIGLDITTKIKEWKFDCFYALQNGIDWRFRLGNKNQKEELDNDILKIIKSNDEVVSVKEFDSQLDTLERTYVATVIIETIYGEKDLILDIGGR